MGHFRNKNDPPTALSSSKKRCKKRKNILPPRSSSEAFKAFYLALKALALEVRRRVVGGSFGS